MNKTCRLGVAAALAAIIAATAFVSEASANPFNFFGQPLFGYGPPTDNGNQARADLQRRVVDFRSNEAPGTIIIDTGNTYLYFILPGGQAIRYGIGVGREGFTWTGVKTIERKTEWPDWHPPADMLARQPYLPRFMAGGPGNPPPPPPPRRHKGVCPAEGPPPHPAAPAPARRSRASNGKPLARLEHLLSL